MKKMKRFSLVFALLPFALLILLFQILPLFSILINSFTDPDGFAFSLKQYAQVFTSAFYLQSIGNSLGISFFSSVLGMVISLIAAHSLTRLPLKIREPLLVFSNMTANFAGVPLAFAFMILLGYNGLFTILLKQLGLDLLSGFNLYSRNGLILVYTYFQVPLGILLIFPAFGLIRTEWQEAAATLGASRIDFWRWIGLPLLLPSILGTFSILFANAMGAYATAYALTTGNINLMTIRIGSLISGNIFLNPYLASAIAMVLGLLLLGLTLLNETMLKRTERFHETR